MPWGAPGGSRTPRAASELPGPAVPLLCAPPPAPVKALLQSSSLALWALPNAGLEALGTGEDKPGQAVAPQGHRPPHACSLSKSSYF